MAARAALAMSNSVSGTSAIQEAVEDCVPFVKALHHRTAPGKPANALRAVEVIAVDNFGARAGWAAVRRRIKPHTRLLLCVSGPSHCPQWVLRLLLRNADAVVADGDDSIRTVLRLSASGPRVFAIANSDREALGAFLGCPPCRTAREAHRLIFADDLSPQAGAADFLMAAMAWAGQNPGRLLDICWMGNGMLKEVLKAQPVPPNLSHRFINPLPAPEAASLFAESGILVAPTACGHAGHPILQAMAASLPVLGSSRCQGVQRWVRDAKTGWVFDPLDPRAMFQALDQALATSPEKLDLMRRTARSEVEMVTIQNMRERVRYAVEMLLE